MTKSIAQCRVAGTIFEAYEAVAIAQQLISSLQEPGRPDQVHPPYGPPSVENVWLNEDGTVDCRCCTVTPAVSEIGNFLEQLLPPGSTRVPGGLRYTVARALLNVDVPPFDSLDELSSDLVRHERGDRAEIVRHLVVRSSGRRAIAAVPLVERRMNRASATSLRRELREADHRLYQQQCAPIAAEPAVIDLVAVSPPPARARSWNATAACVAAGLTLMGAGELMHVRSASTPPPPPVVMAQIPVIDAPRLTPVQSIAGPERGIIAVRDISTRPVPASRPEVRAVKRSARPPARSVRRGIAAHPARRGMLDRLRLRWLRNAFTPHSDL
ncbi:MAG: hypothetical protein ACRD2I_16165 [Vicinamibacterales bacterium]